MSQPRLEFDVRLERPGFTLSMAGQSRPGITALFGTSGCGKTTFLRCIAGLEPNCRGRVRLDEEVWLDDYHARPAYQRNVGLVFQDARLFAHLTVAGNLAYALRRRQREGPALEEVIDTLGIGHLQQSLPSMLSGGEAQRVALARALVAGPSLLLLDEPLAALDYGRRRRIMALISEIPERFGISVFYVTHARQEVLELADHLMLLDKGRCILHERVDTAFSAPANWARLGDLDPTVIWEGCVLGYDAAYSSHQIDTPGGVLSVPNKPIAIGQSVRMRIRSNDVRLLHQAAGSERQANVLPVVVVSTQELSAGVLLVELKTPAGGRLWSDIDLQAAEQFEFNRGAELQALIRPHLLGFAAR